MKQDQKDKINLGETDLLDDSYLDRKNHKLRITTYIDGDVYDKLQEIAATASGRYQTELNQKLREVLNLDKPAEPRAISSEEFEARLAAIAARVSALKLEEFEETFSKKIDSWAKDEMEKNPHVFAQGKKSTSKKSASRK